MELKDGVAAALLLLFIFFFSIFFFFFFFQVYFFDVNRSHMSTGARRQPLSTTRHFHLSLARFFSLDLSS
jgi:hypothetical protein